MVTGGGACEGEVRREGKKGKEMRKDVCAEGLTAIRQQAMSRD